MGRWDADSDRDYEAARGVDGPFYALVTRTCARCQQQFEMEADLNAPYAVRVLCPPCERIAFATQERIAGHRQAIAAGRTKQGAA